MQRFFPEWVDIAMAQSLEPTVLTPKDWARWGSGWSDARQVVPQGYNGDPASIKPELADEFINEEASSIAQLIESYLQGRYEAPVIE